MGVPCANGAGERQCQKYGDNNRAEPAPLIVGHHSMLRAQELCVPRKRKRRATFRWRGVRFPPLDQKRKPMPTEWIQAPLSKLSPTSSPSSKKYWYDVCALMNVVELTKYFRPNSGPITPVSLTPSP